MILAIDSKNWLWKNNDLAWKISKDMKHFQKITVSTSDSDKANALIMGRKTWESIPLKFRPLPGRVNCVLSRNENLDYDWAAVYSNFEIAYSKLATEGNIENIFVIGWSQIYNTLLSHEKLSTLYITHVEWDYNCDVFFDWIPDSFELKKISSKQQEWDIEYYFAEYTKKQA
jgi:dihydrofolate reductase